jgi:hypothetical protein
MVQNSARSGRHDLSKSIHYLATLDWDLIAGVKNAPDLSGEHEALANKECGHISIP